MIYSSEADVFVVIRREKSEERNILRLVGVDFVARRSLESEELLEIAGYPQVGTTGALYWLLSDQSDGLRIAVGRTPGDRFPAATAVVTESICEVLGDPGIFRDLPERLEVGPGTILERDQTELRVRRFDLHAILERSEYSELRYPEMPPVWAVDPGFQWALLSRHKGSRVWPVLDLNSGEILTEMEVPGTQMPRVGVRDDGLAVAAVHDQLHLLDTESWRIGEGIRLKDDKTGSYVSGLAFDRDGRLLVSWFARGRNPLIESAPDDLYGLVQTIQSDPEAYVRSLGAAAQTRSGAILRVDVENWRVVDAAFFDQWVEEPIVMDGIVYGIEWAKHEIHASQLQAVDWPFHPIRPPAEKMWM